MKDIDKEKLLEDFLQRRDFLQRYSVYRSIDVDSAYHRFCERVGVAGSASASVFRQRMWWWGIAASVMLLLGVAFANRYVEDRRQKAAEQFLSAVKPGKSCAFLTTADGREVQLAGGAVAIDTLSVLSEVSGVESVTASTVTVPRGGEYRLILSDGTVVYLNSESSITFPSRFAAESREVAFSGEGYFEIAHSATVPFVVHVNGVSVKQYGTEFNVRAYSSSLTEVTLVRGSIGVTVGHLGECMLVPGRQARVADGKMTICSADLKSVTAWKDGLFLFDDAPLADMTTTLSRWYDVDIHVSPALARRRFTGSLMRGERLADILDAIGEITNTTFSIHDNTIEIHD